MVQIVSVIGTRPEFIRAAVLTRTLRIRYAGLVSECVVHTGQHYDHAMSEQFFEELEIPAPALNLDVRSGSHAAQTAAIMNGLEPVLATRAPDAVVVHGDTNSTVAAALTAAKLGIPVVHIEAGLRSGDRSMPEEQNRIVTDHLASLLLCPTARAVSNLSHEGIIDNVCLVGDLSYDAYQFYYERVVARRRPIVDELPEAYRLLTLHRAENTDDLGRLQAIVDAINALADLPIVFPAHPRIRGALTRHGVQLGGHVRIRPPVGFLDMIALQARSRCILTDSGGVQKEAYFVRRPCFTLRDNTEWTETVDSGWNTLVGADTDRIVAAVHGAPERPRTHPRLFGDGRASLRIAAELRATNATWAPVEERAAG